MEVEVVKKISFTLSEKEAAFIKDLVQNPMLHTREDEPEFCSSLREHMFRSIHHFLGK